MVFVNVNIFFLLFEVIVVLMKDLVGYLILDYYYYVYFFY